MCAADGLHLLTYFLPRLPVPTSERRGTATVVCCYDSLFADGCESCGVQKRRGRGHVRFEMSSVPAYDDCVSKRGAIRQLSRLKKGHSSAGPSALYKERTSRGLSWPGRARGERAARRPRSGAPSCSPRPTHRRTAPYWPPRRPPRTCSSSRIQLCSPLSQDCSPRRCVPAPVPVPLATQYQLPRRSYPSISQQSLLG